MRAVFAIVALDLRQLVKERTQLLTMIALPLILTYFFGLMLGGSEAENKVAVALADLDGTRYSKVIASSLSDDPSFAVQVTSEKNARQLVADGKVAATIIIPRGFGDRVQQRDARIVLIKDPRASSAVAVAQVVQGAAGRVSASEYAAQLAQAYYAAAFKTLRDRGAAPAWLPAGGGDYYAIADGFWEPKPPVSVQNETAVASNVRGDSVTPGGFAQFSLGFTLMFMIFMATGTASGILEEREHGTLRRLLSTPVSKGRIIAGKVLGVFVTTMAQAALMVAVGMLFFHVPWGYDPLGVALVLVPYALAVTGLGILITALVRSRGQASGASSLIATALSMLGGCYWSIDLTPPLMQRIAQLTPTGWGMVGLVDVVVRHQGPTSAMVPGAVLLGFAAVFVAVGTRSLKFE